MARVIPSADDVFEAVHGTPGSVVSATRTSSVPGVSGPATHNRRWDLVERAVVAGAVVAGVVLRFVADSPVWLDEALSINIASSALGDIPDALRHDGHPPLYYFLLHVWMGVFGESETSARALSGMVGIGALVAVVALAARLGGRRLMMSAAVVMAVMPFAVRYSSEARMYSLVTFLVAAGWLALDGARRSPTIGRLGVVAVMSGALLLTHYWSIYLLGVVGIALVWRAWRGTHRAVETRLALAVAAGGLAFLPWLSTFSYQAEHTGTPWATPPRPTQVLSESATGLAGGFAPEAVLLLIVVTVLISRALSAAWGGRASDDRTRWLLWSAAAAVGTIVFGSAAGLATSSAFQARYAAVIVPMVALVIAAGVSSISSPPVRVAALAVVTILATGATAVDLRHDRSQSGSIAWAIESTGVAGDVVVVCPDQLGPALSRQLDGSVFDLMAFPALSRQGTVAGTGPIDTVDWVDYAERNEATDPAAVAEEILVRTPPTSSLWLVWNDGYRTVTGQCSALIDALVQSRPGPEPVVEAEPAQYFEHANLFRFAPVE